MHNKRLYRYSINIIYYYNIIYALCIWHALCGVHISLPATTYANSIDGIDAFPRFIYLHQCNLERRVCVCVRACDTWLNDRVTVFCWPMTNRRRQYRPYRHCTAGTYTRPAIMLRICFSRSLTFSPLPISVTQPSTCVCVYFILSLSISLSLCGSRLIYRAISFSNLSPETRTGHWRRPRGIAYIIMYVRVRVGIIYTHVCAQYCSVCRII